MLNQYVHKAINELIAAAKDMGWYEGYEHAKKGGEFPILRKDSKERLEKMERILKGEIESAIKDAIEEIQYEL